MSWRTRAWLAGHLGALKAETFSVTAWRRLSVQSAFSALHGASERRSRGLQKQKHESVNFREWLLKTRFEDKYTKIDIVV